MTSAEVQSLFWDRWSDLNRTHRLHELIEGEGIREALLEKLDTSIRLHNSYREAADCWSVVTADGWRKIRESIL